MNTDERLRLATLVLDLPVDQSLLVDNGCWRFTVHRYEDCWICLWEESVFQRFGKLMYRDIGRVFYESVDLCNLVLGYPMPQYVLEAQDIAV